MKRTITVREHLMARKAAIIEVINETKVGMLDEDELFNLSNQYAALAALCAALLEVTATIAVMNERIRYEGSE